MEYIILDGADYLERSDFYGDIRTKMNFPEYFGNNLDALHDCLCERGTPTSLILLNQKELKEHLGNYAEGIRTVLRESAEENGNLQYHEVHWEEE